MKKVWYILVHEEMWVPVWLYLTGAACISWAIWEMITRTFF